MKLSELTESVHGRCFFLPCVRGFDRGTRFHRCRREPSSLMDQAYLEYLDTQLKKESEISIKNGFMKSYKILRAQDDDTGWNMLILREYDSFASLEKNEEKADEVLRQATGIDDQKGMQGYTDRSKIRDVVGTKFMRELVLK